MKRLLHIILLILPYWAQAQVEKNAAILVYDKNRSGKFNRIVLDKVIKAAESDKNVTYAVYDWEIGNSIKFVPGKLKEEIPVQQITYLSYVLTANENPPLVIEVDTSGKTKAAYFQIRPGLTCTSKTIDVKTSQILDYSYFNALSDENSTDPMVTRYDMPIDFMKEFGGDPTVIRKKSSTEFEKLEAKIKEKFQPKIQDRLTKVFIRWGDYSAQKIYNLDNIGTYKYFTLIKDDLSGDENKIKTIKSTATAKDGIRVGDMLDLYEVVKFDNFNSTKKVNMFIVKEVTDTGSSLDLHFFGNKKRLAETIKEGNDLVLFINENSKKEFNRKLNKIEDFQTVAVKKSCLFCESELEFNLLLLPSVKLIERTSTELKYFRNLAKSEKFIDIVDNDDQYKQLGVRYLFYSDNKILKSTDIETGRIIGSEEGVHKLLGMKSDNSRSPRTIKTLLSQTFGKEMQILAYSKESKNKVKELTIANPYGLSNGEFINIFTVETEDVNGKKIDRHVQIGDGYISKAISNLVGILNVRDGEKEIYEARESNKKIIFKYNLSK